MGSFNEVNLIGHLGDDPRGGTCADGKPWTRFSVATNTKFGDIEQTQWHQIATFGPRADTAKTYLRKGSQVHIRGWIQHQKVGEGDQATWYTTIICTRLTLLGSPKGNEPTSDTDDPPF